MAVSQPGTFPFMHGINKKTAPTSSVTTQDKLIKFAKDNGFDFIRYPIYWEQYEADRTGMANKIEETADAADKYGIKIIYDNHQYNISSYFGAGGVGFPTAMMQSIVGPVTAYPTIRDAQKAFMRKYWDNSATWNGKSLWDAQADFMLSAFATYKDRASTWAYEIFNEPPLLQDSDHEKLRACQQYIGNKLVSADPDAHIVVGHRFQWYAVASGSFWSATEIPRSIPTISNGRVIYGPHWYLDGTLTQTGFDYVVGQITKVQAAINKPVVLGEWNDRTVPADLTKYQYVINTFKLKGWPVSIWQLDGADSGNRCFNTNYDPEPARQVWSTLQKAMGRTQVGSPK